MEKNHGAYSIRAARCTIEDKSAFLQLIREISLREEVHIICFNADLLAGRRHAESAVMHAARSYESAQMISNTLEMEALLYAAGSRQCNSAVSFGIHEGINSLWVCCYPDRARVWSDLGKCLHYIADDGWDAIDSEKRDRLRQLFDITSEELDAVGDPDRITDLVLERVALLQVIR